jgi:hypothetical protein
MADMKVKLRPWIAPNFAVPEAPARPREEGIDLSHQGIHVSNIPAETLAEMADEWRAELFRKAGKKDPRHE